ncbi:MAG TPA: LamG domain-containing protein, partial [Verrucomicrobiae bacterium]|nr:LamG domain-containing protein [Verrucomicrobiae bacterium]
GWVKWYGGSEWSRIFDFGRNNQDYFFFTPADSSSYPQCSITTDIAIYNQQLESPVAFPINQWTHFAVVMDGRQGILYLNGSAVAVNNSVNLLPSDIGATQCYLGKSQYSSDPYFYGLMDSIALNASPLTSAQLLAPIPTLTLPTNGTLFSGGLNLSYAGTATDYAGNPLPASAFTWTGTLNTNGSVTTAFGPVSGVTNGSYQIPTNGPYATNAFYTVNLTVTDTNGNQQIISMNVLPQLAQVTFATMPSGLQIGLDGQPVTGPSSSLEIAGMNHVVSASSPQNFDGTNYNFVLWSDGGAATHNFVAPFTNATLTASYLEPFLTETPGASGLNISWPSWAGKLAIYSTTNLAQPHWMPVTNAPVSSNGNLTITVPATNGNQFFRLQSN